jgi:hypothetical protein
VGRGSGPQHSVRRLPGSGQVQSTSWRNFAPFSSSTFKTIHGEQAGKRDRGGSAVGARHIVREHDTTQPVLNKDIKRAQSQTAPGVPCKRVLGLKVLQRAGARRPGEKLARSITSPLVMGPPPARGGGGGSRVKQEGDGHETPNPFHLPLL